MHSYNVYELHNTIFSLANITWFLPFPLLLSRTLNSSSVRSSCSITCFCSRHAITSCRSPPCKSTSSCLSIYICLLCGRVARIFRCFFWNNSSAMRRTHIHVNGVLVVDSHYLDVFFHRIPTARGYCSQFQTKSSVAAANRKWFSGAVPRVSDVIFRWLLNV